MATNIFAKIKILLKAFQKEEKSQRYWNRLLKKSPIVFGQAKELVAVGRVQRNELLEHIEEQNHLLIYQKKNKALENTTAALKEELDMIEDDYYE